MSEGIGREFMEKTRYRHMAPSDGSRQAAEPEAFWSLPANAPRLPLPPPASVALAPLDLLALVTRRRSLRRFAPEPLSLPELSFLLWCTQGLKKTEPVPAFRTVPSAGARHAFETLLLVNRVTGVAAGLHAYDPREHAVVSLPAPADIALRVAQACLDQQFLTQCAVAFAWVAVPYRMTWRYGERGYRYLHLDAGHVCQNLYLAAEAIGAGACAVGAFDDDALSTALELDPEEALPIYLAAVGKR